MDLFPGLRGFREWKKALFGLHFRVTKKVRAPIVAATTANDTLLIIPAGSIIYKAFIRVLTAEATGATKTIDVGISGGDEDGFINGISVAATGTIQPTLDDGAQTLGAELSEDESSGDLVPEGYVCAAAVTICYSLGSNDFAELDAEIFIEYLDPS